MDEPEESASAEAGSRTRAARHDRDLAFVGRLLAGDPAALDELRERVTCVPAMVRHQNKRLGDPLDEVEVEDAVRDTVAAVWTKLDRFEGRAALETWVYRFAALEVLKALQRKRRNPQVLVDPATLAEEEEAEVPESLPFDGQDLEAGLGGLSQRAAEVIRLRHFDELSFDEIAARLDAPMNTIKARYYRGLARMRELLERRGRRRA